jgi:RimJ/RimL family protein N-acetyltransferase
MLTGEKVGFRAITADDLAVFDEEIYGDVELFMIASGGPWTPRSLERTLSRHESELEKDDPSKVGFAVEELVSGELDGSAQLWGIDTHNRSAHLGFTLRPAYRGRGLGADTIRVLCDYGFRVRGLHRLQVDTLASNAAARAASEAAGFTIEGQLRSNSWVDGQFLDEVLLGQLASEWKASRGGQP